MRKHLLNGTVALSLALSACSLAPNYQRPEMALPTGWSNVAGVGATQQNTTLFWQEFGSADLNRLIDQRAGAEPRPRSRAAPHRPGPCPGQDRPLAALPECQRQWLVFAHLSKSQRHQLCTHRRRRQLRSRPVGQES